MSPCRSEKQLSADVLVIGGGMAGFFAAIKAKEQGLDVILTDKAFAGRSGGTHYAEGDIQFYRPKERGHKLEQWLEVIGTKGEYVNNPEWNEIVLTEMEDRYNDLVSWGVQFYEENGVLQVDGPHVFSRVPVTYEVVSMKNRMYAPTLRRKAQETGVRIFDRIMMCELLKQDGRIMGAVGFHSVSGQGYVFKAKATIMAVGGGGNLKTGALNTDYWTGDGEGMAYRVGAEIAGKEFSWVVRVINKDIVEERKHLYTGNGVSGRIIDVTRRYPFMTVQSGWVWPMLNADGEQVIHGPWDVHCGKAPLYYDADAMSPRTEAWVRKYFRRVGSVEPDKIGLDYFEGGKILYSPPRLSLGSTMGGSGIWPVDKNCASGLPGLYAAGGSCATMVSGAVYGGLGTGLSAAMVTGTRAARAAADYVSKSKETTIDEAELARLRDVVYAPMERKGGFSPAWLTQALQGIMTPYYVLGVKHEKRLQAALTFVEFMKSHLAPKLIAKDPHEWRMAHETRNMILNAEMHLRASLFRTESRGSHFREDYPRRDDPAWLAWVKLKEVGGEMKAFKEPMPEKFWPDLSKPYEERYPAMLPIE